jgi:uncharacterized protein YndB with AHSA1/START domain
MSTHVQIIGDDVQFTRTFDAPRDLVFAAWTEPDRLAKWWGCAATKSVKATVDLRVGGLFQHIMRIEGAGEFASKSVFTEIDPPRRLAYKSTPDPIPGMPPMPEMAVAVDFIELGDKTEIRLVITHFASSPLRDIVKGGMTDSFEKLARHLNESVHA